MLDLALSLLDYFLSIYPSLTRAEGRKFLGRFGVSGGVQTQVMGNLSDSQKSRVVLAKMAYESPHLLFLDEPTNHLGRAGDGKSASSEESEIMKSRLELAEMAISRQRGRDCFRDVVDDDVSTLSNATTKVDFQSVSEKSTGSVTSDTKDDDERKKEEEKQEEAKAAQEAREEEERRLRREEKLRDMEEAKKLKEFEAQLRAKRDEIEAKKKAEESLAAAALAEAMEQRRIEKEKRKKAKAEARLQAIKDKLAQEEAEALADIWTQEQQLSLEMALLDNPPIVEKVERWSNVAAAVEGKSRNQCLARYRYIKRRIDTERQLLDVDKD
eukprot:gene3635-4525_t